MAKTSKKATKRTVKKTKAEAKPESSAPVPTFESEFMQPLMGLRDQIEDMFGRYSHDWSSRWPRLGQLWDIEPSSVMKGLERSPVVDMSETDKGYEITAEFPGMDEKDLDVNVTDDVLTIAGEKREEYEEKKKGYFLQERRYGQFRRSLRLPQDAEADKINARFDKGVLKVEIPKAADAKQKGRKINVSKA